MKILNHLLTLLLITLFTNHSYGMLEKVKNIISFGRTKKPRWKNIKEFLSDPAHRDFATEVKEYVGWNWENDYADFEEESYNPLPRALLLNIGVWSPVFYYLISLFFRNNCNVCTVLDPFFSSVEGSVWLWTFYSCYRGYSVIRRRDFARKYL